MYLVSIMILENVEENRFFDFSFLFFFFFISSHIICIYCRAISIQFKHGVASLVCNPYSNCSITIYTIIDNLSLLFENR